MADTDKNLADSVAASAQGPKEISVAGMGSSSEHSLNDQIKAAKFALNASTRRRVGAGIRFTKASAGGAV